MERSDIKLNHKLNLSDHIACHDEAANTGRVWSGVLLNENDIEAAKCSFPIQDDVSYNKTTECMIKDIQNKNNILCPAGYFITSYSPEKNKAVCCKLTDGQVNVVSETACSTKFGKEDDFDFTCPDKTYLTSVNITATTRQYKCCPGKKVGSKNGGRDLKNICDDLGIEACTQNQIDSLNKQCEIFGIGQCKKESVNDVYNKCQQYGLFYENNNQIVNPQSYMVCHPSNVAYVKQQCEEKGIDNCTWANLQNGSELVELVDTLDAQNKIYDERITKNEDQLSYLFGWFPEGRKIRAFLLSLSLTITIGVIAHFTQQYVVGVILILLSWGLIGNYVMETPVESQIKFAPDFVAPVADQLPAPIDDIPTEIISQPI